MATLPKHAATASSESQDTTAEGKSVEKKNRLGRTELHNAVCSGDKDYVQQLLKNRASVDATDGSGRTPLHLAASELSEPVKIIELLLEARARTEAEDLSGFTPLNLACDSKCKEAVAVLQSAEGLSKVAEGMTEDQIGTEESPANYTEGTFKELMKDPEVAMQRFTEEMAKEQNPKTLALLYTYRSLARELARRPPPEAEQDRDMANTWAASDPEIQKQIQNVRKWIPIGHRVRGDPLAQQQAEGTDFLLSFTTADKAANDPLLVRLNNGSVRFEGGYR